MAPFAEREFGQLAKGHQRVTGICNWLYENIDYRRGSSNEETTADESLLKRAAACAVTSPTSALPSAAP